MSEISDYILEFKKIEYQKILDRKGVKDTQVRGLFKSLRNLVGFCNVSYPILEVGSFYFDSSLEDFLVKTRKTEHLLSKRVLKDKIREESIEHLGKSNVVFIGRLFHMSHFNTAQVERNYNVTDSPIYKDFSSFLSGETEETIRDKIELFEERAEFFERKIERLFDLEKGDLRKRGKQEKIPFLKKAYLSELVERNLKIFGTERYDLIANYTGFDKQSIIRGEKIARFYPKSSIIAMEKVNIEMLSKVRSLEF